MPGHENGQISDNRHLEDNLSLMQQLGVIKRNELAKTDVTASGRKANERIKEVLALYFRLLNAVGTTQ